MVETVVVDTYTVGIHSQSVMSGLLVVSDVSFGLGFSRKMVEILNEFQAEFSTFNILADDEVRQGINASRLCSHAI